MQIFQQALALFLTSILLLPTGIKSLAPKWCGNTLTTACQSATDVRYDSAYPKTIIGQDKNWEKMEGYWVIQGETLNEARERPEPSYYVAGIGRGLPVAKGDIWGFYNHTIVEGGTRMLKDRFYVFKPAPTSWCDSHPSNGTHYNYYPGVEGSECGVTGRCIRSGQYLTVTHENDGHLESFRTYGGYSYLPFYAPIDETGLTSFPDDSTAVELQSTPGFFSQQAGIVFVKGDQKALVNAYAVNTFLGVQEYTIISSMTKMTEEDWVTKLKESWDEANVPDGNRYDTTTKDASYPNETEWCGGIANDPMCTASPYNEPNCSLKPGAIAGLIIFIAVVLLAMAFFVHHVMMRKQSKRIRLRIIRGIAKNITIEPSAGQIDRATLMKEFDHIDKDKGGTISKDEMREWVELGKIGEVSEKDFNVMWTIMDVDGNNEVDFIEFISFLAACSEEFDETYTEQKNYGREYVSASLYDGIENGRY